jgi:hypothetical protein
MFNRDCLYTSCNIGNIHYVRTWVNSGNVHSYDDAKGDNELLKSAWTSQQREICEYLEGVGARLAGRSSEDFNGGPCPFFQALRTDLEQGAEMLRGRVRPVIASLVALCEERPLKSPLFFQGLLKCWPTLKVDEVGRSGQTPLAMLLDRALELRGKNREEEHELFQIAELLLEHGADPHVDSGAEELSIFHLAMHQNMQRWVGLFNQYAPVAPALANLCTDQELNRLHIACKQGDPDQVKTIAGPINVQLRSRQSGLTALQIACIFHQVDVVKLLIYEYNAVVNMRDTKGRTALYIACALQKEKRIYIYPLVIPLLMKGADPSLCDNEGIGPIDLAMTKELPGLDEILMSYVPKNARWRLLP